MKPDEDPFRPLEICYDISMENAGVEKYGYSPKKEGRTEMKVDVTDWKYLADSMGISVLSALEMGEQLVREEVNRRREGGALTNPQIPDPYSLEGRKKRGLTS